MITPTVGRVVLFVSHGEFEGNENAAIITRVWSNSCVNLVVFSGDGTSHPKTSVRLVQPEEHVDPNNQYCTWMPYQVKKDFGSESGEKSVGQVNI